MNVFFLLLVLFYMGNSFDVFALFSHPCKFMRWKKHQKMKDWAKYLFEGDWATCLSFFVCLRHTHKMYAIWASEDCLILWDDGYNEVLWSVTSHGPFLISLRGNSTNWQTCCCKVFTVIQHSAPTQRQKEYIVSLQHILKKNWIFSPDWWIWRGFMTIILFVSVSNEKHIPRYEMWIMEKTLFWWVKNPNYAIIRTAHRHVRKVVEKIYTFGWI